MTVWYCRSVSVKTPCAGPGAIQADSNIQVWQTTGPAVIVSCMLGTRGSRLLSQSVALTIVAQSALESNRALLRL